MKSNLKYLQEKINIMNKAVGILEIFGKIQVTKIHLQ